MFTTPDAEFYLHCDRLDVIRQDDLASGIISDLNTYATAEWVDIWMPALVA